MGELHVLATGSGKGTLTEEQKNEVTKMISSLPKSKETEIYEEIKSNPEIVGVDKEGYSKSVNVTHYALTGETNIDDFNLDDFDTELTEKEKIDYDVTPEDIRTHSEMAIANFENMSDEAALELVKLVNRTRKGDKVKFADLPEEIRDGLKEYLCNVLDVPVSDFSEKSNRIRNEVADAIMKEFINQIEIDKYMENYNYKIEHLYDETINDISPIFKQYNDANNKYFEELVEKAETPEKKELGKAILAAIKDGFEMTRIKEAIPYTKIKKFELGKPNRVFDSLHSKYTSPKYHIYNIYGCAVTLSKHLYTNGVIKDANEARDYAIKILLVFCKVCLNYKTSNPAEHAFMYYFTYNIYLMDVYKGEQYEEYVKEYLGKIQEVIEVFKQNGK